jgi:hypothetical protein
MRKAAIQLVLVLSLVFGGNALFTMKAAAQPTAQDRDQHRDNDQNRDRDRAVNRDNDRDHDRDARWANNPAYQQGLREGFEDHDNHKHKHHKQHFQNKEDRDAYKAGYNHGWKGDEQYRPH